MRELFSDIALLEKISKKKAEKNLSDSYNYLLNDIKNVARIEEDYYLPSLLKRASLEANLSRYNPPKDDWKRVTNSLLPVFLGSVAVSTFLKDTGDEREISDKVVLRLKALTEDALKRLLWAIDNYIAILLSDNTLTREEALHYRNLLYKRLFEDQVTSETINKDVSVYVASKRDSIINNNDDPELIYEGLSSLAFKGLLGINKMQAEVRAYNRKYTEVINKNDGYRDLSDEARDKQIALDMGMSEESVNKLWNESEGFDLFYPEFFSSLPHMFYADYLAEPMTLDLFSYLKRGIWPVEEKPFLLYSRRYYSFTSERVPYFLRLTAIENSKNRIERELSFLFDKFTENYDVKVLPSVLDSHSPEEYKKIMAERKMSYPLIIDSDATTAVTGDKDNRIIAEFILSGAVIYPESEGRDLIGFLRLDEEKSEEEIFEESDEYEVGNQKSTFDPSLDNLTEDDDYVGDEYEEEEPLYRDSDPVLPDTPPYIPPTKEELEALEDKYSIPEEVKIKEEKEEEEEFELSEPIFDEDLFDDDKELDLPLFEDEPLLPDEIFEEVNSEDEEEEDEVFLDPDQLLFDFFDDDEQIDNNGLDNSSKIEEDTTNEVIAEEVEDTPEELIPIEKQEEIPTDDSESNLEEAIEVQDDSSLNEEQEVSTNEDIEGVSTAKEETQEELVPIDNQEELSTDDSESNLEESIEVEDNSSLNEEQEVSTNADIEEASEAVEEDAKEELVPLEKQEEIFTEESESTPEKPIEMEGCTKPVKKATNLEKRDDKPSTDTSNQELFASEKGIIKTILDSVGTESEFFKFVSYSSREMLEMLEEAIYSCFTLQQNDNKDKTLTIDEYSLTILVAASGARDILRYNQLLNSVGGIMYARHATSWTALIVHFGEDGKIDEALERSINKDTFSLQDWKRVIYIGEQILQKGKKNG